jgi:predicted dinucleotide-binding enzyme
MDDDTTHQGEPQRVAVIGPGKVGSQLVRGFARAGHQVAVGARDASKAAGLAAIDGVEVLDPVAAAAGAEVVVLAVPLAALTETITGLGDLRGKVLVDATNAVDVPVPDGHATVGAHVAALAPGALVVKAFNTIGAEHLADGTIGGSAVFLPVAGDDEGRPVVVALAASVGFEVADLGGPEAIGLVEDAARLWIHLAFRCGWGRGFAFGVLRA